MRLPGRISASDRCRARRPAEFPGGPPAMPGDDGAFQFFLAVRTDHRVIHPDKEERIGTEEPPAVIRHPEPRADSHHRADLGFAANVPGLLGQFPDRRVG